MESGPISIKCVCLRQLCRLRPDDDTQLDDEFYWAAAELFITTGKEGRVQKAVLSSPYYLVTRKGDIEATGDLYWQGVSAAGICLLRLFQNSLPEKDLEKARANIIKLWMLPVHWREGYQILTAQKEYPWVQIQTDESQYLHGCCL